ncbi:MAG: outer membrane protein [Paracoccaceae bacterium]
MRNILMAAAVALAPCAATAGSIYGEDGEVLYLGARSGASFVSETDFNITGANVENEYDFGFVVGAFVGFGTEITDNIGVRGELELGGQFASVDTHSINGAAQAGSFGDTQQRHAYFNFVSDYAITNSVTGFVGGGVGLASVQFNGHGVPAAGVVMNDSDHGLAYNLTAGVGYQLADGAVMEGMYRYMGTSGVELQAADATVSDADLTSHNFLLGLRLGF